MGKMLIVLLAVSAIINIVLTIHAISRNASTIWKPTWSEKAAAEAEATAAVSCSGHGRAYLDGLGVLDDQQPPPCECNSCYTGEDCSVHLPDCLADADAGDPMFLEPFWMNHKDSSALVISGWHRMSYRYDDGTIESEELEKVIRKLHDMVGNAVTDNRFIVFGAGSTHVLSAAVHALSSPNSPSPAKLVTSIPYYSLYKDQAELFNSADFKFEGDPTGLKNNDTGGNITRFIEIVTSPNNPDGMIKKAILDGPNVKTIHDYAYYWPHFAPIQAPVDEEVSVFTISKITGHAGSRFGWALVRDEAVYKRMQRFILISSLGVCRETQLRALQLLKVVTENGGKEIFEFGYETVKNRWETLNKTLAMSKRFSFQTMEPAHCNYFKRPRHFTPAYAWVKCERREDRNCYDVFNEAKIRGRAGKVFGADERFVRLSLIKAQDDFDVMIERLNNLVSEEDTVESI